MRGGERRKELGGGEQRWVEVRGVRRAKDRGGRSRWEVRSREEVRGVRRWEEEVGGKE